MNKSVIITIITSLIFYYVYIIIQDILYNGLCINCTILTEINNQIKEGEGGVRERERETEKERGERGERGGKQEQNL